ncbi:enoyl-CoA hydratase/isomerase [Geobacter metallireducens GS-15]|uniref:Enoyl-CoA hydratase/isomerase n=1 Tax=Geobacter metallireducens (strain ATCC 53774 / DSM 7210 / GS-15) TaxID=269799 RepID=Q39TK1_GEOMG|nr:enoyl-CoA hydratase-related protein [Geobacter metallireducens]ABB32423.1 enoyl-CoA hydratase/isomerase [Geobacter metallireducens GS-15]
MSAYRYERDGEGIVTVTINPAGQPASIMDEGTAGELLDRLERDTISGVIITIDQASPATACTVSENSLSARQQVFNRLSAYKSMLRRLETLGKPVVAAINGPTQGRDYELCLAAHHRIAVNDLAIAIGLPDVAAGLIPCNGGVARLVRLIGLEKGLPLLMAGTKLAPEKAKETGLIDQLAASSGELQSMARDWIAANPAAGQPWDQKGYKMPGGTPSSPNIAQQIFVAPAILRKKCADGQPAQESILAVAVEGAQVDLESALRIESRYFTDLLFRTAAG